MLDLTKLLPDTKEKLLKTLEALIFYSSCMSCLFWKDFIHGIRSLLYARTCTTGTLLARSGETCGSNSRAIVTAASGFTLTTLIVPTTTDGNTIIIVAHFVAVNGAQSFVRCSGTPLGNLYRKSGIIAQAEEHVGDIIASCRYTGIYCISAT